MSDRAFCAGACFRDSVRACSIAAAVLVLGAGSLSASELRRTAIVKAAQRARVSVVNIHGHKTLVPNDEGYHEGEPPQRVNGMGTGVVIDERGYIITNYHVVDGVRRIQVTLANEQTFTATLISHDPKTDLAIIKIPTVEKLQVITVGTSSDLMPGEPVIAVGNAYGYENTVTVGIVSALHRTVQVSDTQNYRDLIQTDASINPGNSGGPLLNIDGEMVGINVAVRAGAQGIGFAIPVDVAISVAAKLISVKRLEGKWHGIVPLESADGADKRLRVAQVEQGSPAAKAGLQAGDVITSIGSEPTERAVDLEKSLLGRKAGEAVRVSLLRSNQPVNVEMVLVSAPRKASDISDRAWELMGMKFDPVSPREFRQTKTRYRGGLLVTEVRPDSPAARQGIRADDILVGIHVWETISLDNIAYILNAAELADGDPPKFFIVRGNSTFFCHLPVSVQR